jgi:hypothetical protein
MKKVETNPYNVIEAMWMTNIKVPNNLVSNVGHVSPLSL